MLIRITETQQLRSVFSVTLILAHFSQVNNIIMYQINSSVVLFFVDGLGIGGKTPANPLFTIKNLTPLANFRETDDPIFENGILVPTDATLGIEGRPQSASGQTTIYTGLNAPQILGNHKQGFPNEKLRELIKEHSIFLQLEKKGVTPNIFANTYTPQFFEKTPHWKSATTCAVEAADMHFCKLPDLLGHKSVFHDFTNESLIEKGFDVPKFSPVDAAGILADLSRQYRFVLYEHFITDKIGHQQDFAWAERHLPQLAEFLRETITRINSDKTTFILTSDHGNIEDLSIRNHTRNKIPTIVWGRNKHEFARSINDLSDITPAIIKLLS